MPYQQLAVAAVAAVAAGERLARKALQVLPDPLDPWGFQAYQAYRAWQVLRAPLGRKASLALWRSSGARAPLVLRDHRVPAGPQGPPVGAAAAVAR
jgi:hypothetical protein